MNRVSAVCKGLQLGFRDIACAGALATHAHTESRWEAWAGVALETCWSDGRNYHPYSQ